MTERTGRAYRAEDVVVYFDPRRCIHSGQCLLGLPQVFDRESRPWIRPDRAAPEAVSRVVARCPSGALRAERTDGTTEAAPDDATVVVVPNGPLYLRGSTELHLGGGASRHETRLALCRCGHSQNKPFCDNSHVNAGFRG